MSQFHSEQVIRTLYQITADYQQGFDQQVKQLLQLGCERFDLEIGILSRITINDYIVEHCICPDGMELEAKTRFKLKDNYCTLTLAEGGPLGYEHVGKSEISVHPAYREFALESYIGIPIYVEQKIYGTLNFSSPYPRSRKFQETDIEALQLMGVWIGAELSRRQREKELWLAEERFRIAIDASPSPMVMVNSEGLIILTNQATEKMFGYSSGEMLNQSVEILVPDNVRKLHPRFRESFVRRPKPRAMGAGRDLMGKRKDGRCFPVSIGLNPIETPEGPVILVAIVDLTERKRFEEQIVSQSLQLKKANEELYLQATTDSLTGLANRRSLFTHLKSMLQLVNRSSRSLSLLLIDLDLFKKYNDEFGHPAGDKALKEVAASLLYEARGSDLVARYGGEEFAIILPETDKKGAMTIGARILESVKSIGNLERQITVSIGAATLEFEAERELDPMAVSLNLIEVADQGLYQSKAQGRNRITHYEDFIRESRKHLFMS
ncbi:MAG: diguanylate cyclase [Motiliproteus sp.]|nr:diguanylate cyclase [Motiliproteus sp.]MCW9052897.1 diguanylate cyclase [Motiliproteus sp.]